MGHREVSRVRKGIVFVALTILMAGGPVLAQAPPPVPPAPTQVEPQPTTQAVTPSEVQPRDPFAGSPFLQMFESPVVATDPIRQLRFAPLPETPAPLQLRLFLTAEEEFTDNKNQTKNNRESEFRTRIVPGIAIGADRPIGSFSLSYAPEVYFPGNSIGDTQLNQNLSVRANWRPTGPFQLNFADDFTDSSDFRDIQDPGARATGSNGFLSNVVTLEAAYVLPRLRTGLAYTNTIYQEDLGFWDTKIAHIVRPNVAYTDPRFSLAGGFTYTRGNLNSSVEAPYSNYEVDARYLHVVTPAINVGVTGYYQYQEYDLGLNFTLGRARLVGTFQVGPDGTAAIEAGADVFDGTGRSTQVEPSAAISYTQRFNLLAVTARYEHGYRNRTNELANEGITLTRTAGIALTSSYFRNLTGTLGVQYVENQYETASLSGPPRGTTERTVQVDVGVNYLLARSLSLYAGYTGIFRFSTQESDEFNENLARLGVRYQFDLF